MTSQNSRILWVGVVVIYGKLVLLTSFNTEKYSRETRNRDHACMCFISGVQLHLLQLLGQHLVTTALRLLPLIYGVDWGEVRRVGGAVGRHGAGLRLPLRAPARLVRRRLRRVHRAVRLVRHVHLTLFLQRFIRRHVHRQTLSIKHYPRAHYHVPSTQDSSAIAQNMKFLIR